MIELKNVSKFYNDNKIVTVGLRNVSLKLNKGEFVAITGDSGSGKSTLLNVISSIDGYDDGEILFYGNETFYFNRNDSDTFRKNNVSFIFQKYNIVDSYTVLENVMLPLLIKGRSEEEARSEAFEIIRRVGLEDRINNKGTKLSGGEKQRCVIARALAADAPILACDEPTGNLDSQTSREIIELIREVSKDKLVLVVTHDYDSIKDVCTRKIKMSDGEVVEDVTFSETEDDEPRPLELDYAKPPRTALLRLARLNIFSTPKKTVFSTLVFTFVSCILLLLSLLMVKVSYEANYSSNERYGITADKRAIIYTLDHTALDLEGLARALDGTEYYINAFFEEGQGSFAIGNNLNGYWPVTFADLSYELVNGDDPTALGEYILIMPESYYYQSYSNAVGDDIQVGKVGEYLTVGKLVGVGISDDVNTVYLMSRTFDQRVADIVVNSEVRLNYNVDGVFGGTMDMLYLSGIERSYVAVPEELEGRIDLDFNLAGIYGVSYDLETVYTNEVVSPTLFCSPRYFEGEITPALDGVMEITVYTEDMNALMREAESLGYLVSVPSMTENKDSLSLIVLYMLSYLIFIALVIMFYISFAVIQRIYLTKTKDYSIFRTLGLVSRDLKKVLFIEVMAISISSVLLGAILTNVIIALTKSELHKHFSVIMVLLYVLVMLVFGVLIAARLNNKIFKNSVYQSLKEGGE